MDHSAQSLVSRFIGASWSAISKGLIKSPP
jgi:hypothetical protein